MLHEIQMLAPNTNTNFQNTRILPELLEELAILHLYEGVTGSQIRDSESNIYFTFKFPFVCLLLCSFYGAENKAL